MKSVFLLLANILTFVGYIVDEKVEFFNRVNQEGLF